MITLADMTPAAMAPFAKRYSSWANQQEELTQTYGNMQIGSNVRNVTSFKTDTIPHSANKHNMISRSNSYATHTLTRQTMQIYLPPAMALSASTLTITLSLR